MFNSNLHNCNAFQVDWTHGALMHQFSCSVCLKNANKSVTLHPYSEVGIVNLVIAWCLILSNKNNYNFDYKAHWHHRFFETGLCVPKSCHLKLSSPEKICSVPDEFIVSVKFILLLIISFE